MLNLSKNTSKKILSEDKNYLKQLLNLLLIFIFLICSFLLSLLLLALCLDLYASTDVDTAAARLICIADTTATADDRASREIRANRKNPDQSEILDRSDNPGQTENLAIAGGS